MKKGASFDYYNFKNNTCIDDEELFSFVKGVVANCFSVLSSSFCRDFKGNLRVGIFETGNVDDEPAFEMEFTSRKNFSMNDVDFEDYERDDILFSSFDVSESAFGLIQVALCHKNSNGEIDKSMSRSAYRQIDELLRDTCKDFGFSKYKSNG